MKEHFEMVVHSSEHVTLLTKVLMMFGRRHVEVISVNSQNQPGGSIYRISFLSGRDDAQKLLLQVKRLVDILEAHLAYYSLGETPLKRQKSSRIVHVSVA